MSAKWLEVSVLTDGEAAEAVAEYLQPFAYQQGVVLEQIGNSDDSDPGALLDKIEVKIYLPAQDDTPSFRSRIAEIIYFLGRLYPLPEPQFRILAEEDWATKWKENYQPFSISDRFWITPSWIESHPHQDDAVVITIDPGMAFGTGLHPTTRMCLEVLAQLVKSGDDILDVGTGSGILAIAAAKLGARQVLAIDIDDVAVTVASKNTALNRVAQVVEVHRAELDDVDGNEWDLIIVNILAPVINTLLVDCNLIGRIASSGFIVLAGIIEEQAPEVETNVLKTGGIVQERLRDKDWTTLIIRKSAAAKWQNDAHLV